MEWNSYLGISNWQCFLFAAGSSVRSGRRNGNLGKSGFVAGLSCSMVSIKKGAAWIIPPPVLGPKGQSAFGRYTGGGIKERLFLNLGALLKEVVG